MSDLPALPTVAPPTVRGRSLAADAFRRFFRHPTGLVGLFIVGFFVIASLLAPVLRPYDATRDRAGSEG